jgi:hypothetical protein
MALQKDYDSTKYPICAPWYGESGAPFLRVFQPAFKGGLHTHVDEFASLYDHLMELDPGATPGGVLVPHPGPAFGGQAGVAMQARSTQLYISRRKKLFGLIRRHVEDDAIRDEIDANANGDAVAAWAIVVGHGQPQPLHSRTATEMMNGPQRPFSL